MKDYSARLSVLRESVKECTVNLLSTKNVRTIKALNLSLLRRFFEQYLKQKFLFEPDHQASFKHSFLFMQISLTPLLLMANLAYTKQCKKPEK